MANKIMRQGDLIIRQVEDDGVQRASVGKTHVLAEGEKTGHLHKLESTKEIHVHGRLENGTNVWMRLMGETTLVHDEHAAIALEPGLYNVTQEREYDYAEARAHDVSD